MKTKTSLAEQIKAGKFDWVNPDIESNFKAGDLRGETKLYHFDRSISSEDAVEEMAKEGYLPANISELLAYAKDDWNGTDWAVALGSVALVDGYRLVPYLHRSAAERNLYLLWWHGDRGGRYWFLAVRNSQSFETKPSELSTLETLSLPDTLEINGVMYKKVKDLN